MLNDDQEQFKSVVAKFLGDKSTPGAVRELMATDQGYDPAVWLQLSQELGLLGTHIPESYGGYGFGAVEQSIISYEMGRSLFCGPYFSSAILAGYALLVGADETHKTRLLPGIASGDVLATVLIDDLNDAQGLGRQFTISGEQLSGEADMVVDAHVADLLVVPVRQEQSVRLFVIDSNQAECELLESMDQTRKLSRVRLQSVTGKEIGQLDSAEVDRYWDHINTALAAEMMGGAEHLFSTTIEYMKMRMQFGRLIGSFQGLKHRCADLMLQLELAKATTQDAARYLATGDGLNYAPNMAKAMADCFWERKPVEAQLVATNGLKQDATVSAAMKTGFDACKDVYGEHAVTPQGEPVLLNPQIFLRELRKSDPNESADGGNS